MTKKDIIRMAREVGLPHWYETEGVVNEGLLIKFANLVAKQEREKCAQICDKEVEQWKYDADVVDCAIAIRARGQA